MPYQQNNKSFGKPLQPLLKSAVEKKSTPNIHWANPDAVAAWEKARNKEKRLKQYKQLKISRAAAKTEAASSKKAELPRENPESQVTPKGPDNWLCLDELMALEQQVRRKEVEGWEEEREEERKKEERKPVWERELTVEEIEWSQREWANAVEKAQREGDRERRRR